MPALGPGELLTTWEHGAVGTPASRAVDVLAAAGVDQVLELTLGQRDQALLACYERWFGTDLEAVASCPACGEAVEMSIPVDGLHLEGEPPPAACRVTSDGYDVGVRVPRAGDLLPPPGDVAELLGRCVTSASHRGTDVALADLPPAVVAALEDALAEADPGAELTAELSCPACDHTWPTLLDPAVFVWERIDRWARRLSEDVHVLASTYGWSEADILALTPQRRHLYMEAVRG